MPVSLRELRKRPPEPVRDGSIARAALDLLRSTPGQAWRPSEIADKLEVEPKTLSPQLSRLRQRGLIENEKGHWYALDDREVAKRIGMLATARLATEKLGPENPKAWFDTPQD